MYVCMYVRPTLTLDIRNVPKYTRAGNPSFEHAVRLSPAYGLVQLNAVLSGSVKKNKQLGD